MLKPLRIDPDGTAIFSKSQVDILGPPSEYGFEKYFVIDTENEHVQAADYRSYSHFTKKHRYSRIARFKRILRGLFGESSAVIEPESIISIVTHYLDPLSENPYQACFKILKHYKLPKLYAQIPAILFKAKGIKLLTPPRNFSEMFQETCTKFTVFEKLFFELNDDRKYFPNLQCTALRILESLGVENKYIPHLRTKRKLVVMEKIFTQMEKVNGERRMVKEKEKEKEPLVKRMLGEKKIYPDLKTKKPLIRKSGVVSSKSLLRQYARTWKIPKY